MNNIQYTWKGMKFITTAKDISSDIPRSLSSNGFTITDQAEI